MVNENATIDSSGKARSMVARWIITGNMKLVSAAHFGGEGEGVADMKILRDPKDGVPLLPGTSLAGALRSYLADVLDGYLSKENGSVSRLFGATRSDDLGSQSPLIVFDSLGKIPDGLAIEIRDGVAINSAAGTAEPHKKFDIELIPAGTEFPVRMDLIVKKSEEESKLVSLLAKTLDGLCRGDISLGMRRSRGLGEVTAGNWKAKRFDLTNQPGWLEWVTSDHENPIESLTGFDTSVKALLKGWDDSELTLKSGFESELSKIHDNRKRAVIKAFLTVKEDLLIRSPGDDPACADVVHLKSADKPVLAGTSLAGAIRAQALRIAHLFTTDGQQWIDNLFGPLLENDDDSSNSEPQLSKLRFSERPLSNLDTRRQERIANDRFTGGVVSGALFDEDVHNGGDVEVRMELRCPGKAETGLLLLLLKDLLSGDIPVGGSVSIGRGILKGRAELYLENGITYEISDNMIVNKETETAFNEYIEAFAWQASSNVQEVGS